MSHAYDAECGEHRVVLTSAGCPECGTTMLRSGRLGSPHGTSFVACRPPCPHHPDTKDTP